MRVAAIYDIHGNLPALEAVLEEVRQEHVSHVVVGGDVVPGPMFVTQYVVNQPSAADMLDSFTRVSLQ